MGAIYFWQQLSIDWNRLYDPFYTLCPRWQNGRFVNNSNNLTLTFSYWHGFVCQTMQIKEKLTRQYNNQVFVSLRKLWKTLVAYVFILTSSYNAQAHPHYENNLRGLFKLCDQMKRHYIRYIYLANCKVLDSRNHSTTVPKVLVLMNYLRTTFNLLFEMHKVQQLNRQLIKKNTRSKLFVDSRIDRYETSSDNQ